MGSSNSSNRVVPAPPDEVTQSPVRLPAGLPAADRDLWIQLDPGTRALAVRRLRVVRDWIDREARGEKAPRGSVPAIAEEAGVSRTRLYELVAAFSREPSLASLGVRAAAPTVRRTTLAGDIRAVVEAEMERIIGLDQTTRTEVVLRAVAELGRADAPARTTLLRWLSEIRRRHGAAGPFGGRLSLDVAYLDVVDERIRPYTLYAMLDDGTGLALGWTASAEVWTADAYATVARAASRRLRRMTIGSARVAAWPPELEYFVDDRWLGQQGFALLSHFDGSRLLERDVSSDRAVRPLRRHLGERLGRLRLHSRPPDASIARATTQTALDEVVARAFNQHNKRVCERIGGEERGEQREARRRLADLLATVQ